MAMATTGWEIDMRITGFARNRAVDLQFSGSVAFLVGNSGTWKTLLADNVHTLACPEYDTIFALSENMKQNTRPTLNALRSGTRALYIFDEEVFSELLDVIEEYKTDKMGFVLIQRATSNKMPNGVDNTYELYIEGNTIKARLYFDRKKLCKSEVSGSVFLTEDSRSLYSVLRRLYPDACCVSASGKNRIPTVISSLVASTSCESLCVFVDLCGVGSLIAPLQYLCCKYTFLDMDSFEELVLRSYELFPDRPRSYGVSNCFNQEREYTQILSTMLFRRYGLKYSKSSPEILGFLCDGVCIHGKETIKAFKSNYRHEWLPVTYVGQKHGEPLKALTLD